MAFFLDIAPNWRDSVKESFSFDTGIYESHNRSEVRTAFRPTPKWTLQFNVLIRDRKASSLIRAVTRNRKEQMLLSNPLAVAITSEKMDKDGTTLTFDKTPSWVSSTELVSIHSRLFKVMSWTDTKVVIEPVVGLIENAYLETLYFTTEDDASYLTSEITELAVSTYATGTPELPPGTKVFQVLTGVLAAQTTIQWETTRVGQSSLVFTAEPHQLPAYAMGSIPVYRELKAWDLKPNWRAGVSTAFDSLRDEYEGVSGVTDYSWRAAYLMRTWSAEFSARQDAQKIAAFFCWCRGRQKTFYFPDLTSVILPYGPVDDTQKTLKVSGGSDIFDLDQDDTIRFVRVSTVRGDFIRRLVNIGEGDPVSYLTLEDPPPFSCSAAEIISIQVLFQARFLEDTLTIEWITSSFGVVNVQVRSIDYQEPGEPVAIITETDIGLLDELASSPIITEVFR